MLSIAANGLVSSSCNNGVLESGNPPRCPDLLTQGKTIHLWHHDVEYNEVVVVVSKGLQGPNS